MPEKLFFMAVFVYNIINCTMVKNKCLLFSERTTRLFLTFFFDLFNPIRDHFPLVESEGGENMPNGRRLPHINLNKVYYLCNKSSPQQQPWCRGWGHEGRGEGIITWTADRARNEEMHHLQVSPWGPCTQQNGCACAQGPAWPRQHRIGPPSLWTHHAETDGSEGHHHSSDPRWSRASLVFEMHTSYTQWMGCLPVQHKANKELMVVRCYTWENPAILHEKHNKDPNSPQHQNRLFDPKGKSHIPNILTKKNTSTLFISKRVRTGLAQALVSKPQLCISENLFAKQQKQNH